MNNAVSEKEALTEASGDLATEQRRMVRIRSCGEARPLAPGVLGRALKDKVSLLNLTTNLNRGKAKRAFEAMMTMKKIDIATIEAAAEEGQGQ